MELVVNLIFGDEIFGVIKTVGDPKCGTKMIQDDRSIHV